MKISKGRGIQFFKHPVFTIPGKFVINSYNSGKKSITNLVTKGSNKGKGEKK